MGRAYAEGLASEVNESLTIERALAIHLTSNHYPPVPVEMVGPCRAAIAAANEGDWGRDIDLESVASYKGNPTAPAEALIDNYHLESFLDGDDDG